MDKLSIGCRKANLIVSAVVFYCIYDVEKALEKINIGAKRPLGIWFIIMGNYVFVRVDVLVYILGIIYGVEHRCIEFYNFRMKILGTTT